jgi:peptidyl-prolyl cis-trans isomerase C
MDFMNGSRVRGARLASISLLAAGALASGLTAAETIFTINGTDVDSAVVDIYFESRLGEQGGAATPEQREALMSELRDIYILSTQDSAKALAENPRVAAQIELQTFGILAQAVAGEFFANSTASEEEILAEYNNQVELAPPLQFKARHILVATQGEAVAIIAELNEGADFEELAKEKSTGPSGPNGGDLGWFSPNQMVEPFSNAVQALEDGQYSSTPTQTQFGWHIILREDSRESEAPTLDSVRENIIQVVQQSKFTDYLDALREKATQ